MSVALGGNLRDFGIAEVFQLIGQQRKTGLLEITERGKTVRLAFDEGRVVWASPVGASEHAVLGETLVRSGLMTQERLAALRDESESSARSLPDLLISSGVVTEAELEEMYALLTRETVFEVLRWTQGSFHFTASPVQHSRPPEGLLAAEQILMDGLRMLDEWQAFSKLVPSADTVFDRSATMAVYRERAGGSARGRLAQAEQVFQLVDGRLTAQRIIDLSRLGSFDATRILAELRHSGVIQPVEMERLSELKRGEKRLEPVGRRVGGAFAAAFPLALLALATSLCLQLSSPVEGGVRGFPIERAPLTLARESFERRRVLNALHAHRLLWGEWPDDLAQLDRTGLVGDDALTPSAAESYYYAKREEGILVLAPEL